MYGDNASMDCCIVNRETLLEIIDHYQAADYLDLLDQTVADQLFDPARPILTKAHDVPPSRYATGSHACNTIISAG